MVWPMADWYNAKKRPPVPFVSVLVRMPGEKPMPTVREGYMAKEGVWVAGGFVREPGEVTHWTDMPEFPGDDGEGDRWLN